MDARVRYTKKVVRETFFRLLNEKPVSKLTVKELCEEAGINRATFYKYYANPYDLMDKLENESLDYLQKQIEEIENCKLTDIFRVVLEDILAQKEMYLVLMSENGDEPFKKRIFELCYQENIKTIQDYFPDLSERKQQWLYYALAECCNGILNQWIQGGMEESPEEVVAFVGPIIDAVNRAKLV